MKDITKIIDNASRNMVRRFIEINKEKEEQNKYFKILDRTKDMFNEKMNKLRNDKNNLGKYLIGISPKPWSTMYFEIGTEQDYKKITKGNSTKIIWGGKIK